MAGLGGHLVGIGIGRGDDVEFKWIERPIHNRIVHTGIEHLLRFAGQNSVTYNVAVSTGGATYPECNIWVGHASQAKSSGSTEKYEHWGALYYCAYGDNNAQTSFYDTALKHQLQMTDTKYTGTPYCGSKYVYVGSEKTPSIVRHRISHKFSAVLTETTVREIGWFGRTQDGYVMFSRVALPEDDEVVLKPGEYLVCTYELDETTSIDIISIPINVLCESFSMESAVLRMSDGTGLSWGSALNVDAISVNGTPSCSTKVQSRFYTDAIGRWPAWVNPNPYRFYYTESGASTVITAKTGINSGGWPTERTKETTATISDYVPGTYSRDFTVGTNVSNDSTSYKPSCIINGFQFYIKQTAGGNYHTLIITRCSFRNAFSTEDTVKVLNGETPD